MRKYGMFLAALVAAACAKQVEETAPEGTASEKTWTVEVNAAKGADEARALALNDGYLSAYWSGTDKVEVYDEYGRYHLGTLYTAGGGSTCRFFGTVSGILREGAALQLVYPGSPDNAGERYARQKGTLEDIARRYDYALATTEVIQIDEENDRISLSDAVFVSRQSITLFNFSYTGSETNKITKLTVTSWSLDGPVTVIPDTPGTEFFIAIPGKYGADFDRTGKDKIPYDFVAETQDGTVFAGTMSALLADGKFYKTSKYLTKYESRKQPLTVEVLQDGIVTIQNPLNRTIYYGFEGVNGSAINTHIATGDPIKIEVKAGDKLLLGGKLSSGNRYYGKRTETYDPSTGHYTPHDSFTQIDCDVPYYLYGNIMSLMDYEYYFVSDSGLDRLEDYAFMGLFEYESNLYNHPEKDIELPATRASRGSYAFLFLECTHLTRAPEVPVTVFTNGPYDTVRYLGPCCSMFLRCYSLEKGPSILPATTVPSATYFRMFEKCNALVASPILPASAPGTDAYRDMFYRCTGLKQITCYARSNIGQYKATHFWVEGVPAGGTFISDPSVSWPSGDHGIPAGWNGFVDPLTIEAIEDGVVTIANPQGLAITYGKDIHLSLATTSDNSIITVPVSAGAKLRLWGDNAVYGHKDAVYLYTKISCSSRYKLSGDLRSLVSSGDYVNVWELSDYAFVQLFAHDTQLLSAQDLVLGARSVGERSYAEMFEGCTAMTSAPALPATGLAQGCYENLFAGTAITSSPALPATILAPFCYGGMFRECEGLTQAPALPATNLAEGCYMNMFDYCTSLTKAPELKSPTLVQFCYAYMFRDCHALGAVTCLATNPDWVWDADEPDYEAPNAAALMGWMDNVKATGTFTRAAGVNWPQGAYGVPAGWTITP